MIDLRAGAQAPAACSAGADRRHARLLPQTRGSGLRLRGGRQAAGLRRVGELPADRRRRRDERDADPGPAGDRRRHPGRETRSCPTARAVTSCTPGVAGGVALGTGAPVELPGEPTISSPTRGSSSRFRFGVRILPEPVHGRRRRSGLRLPLLPGRPGAINSADHSSGYHIWAGSGASSSTSVR